MTGGQKSFLTGENGRSCTQRRQKKGSGCNWAHGSKDQFFLDAEEGERVSNMNWKKNKGDQWEKRKRLHRTG